VPLAFELGEAFQFDWSEEGLVVGGVYYRLQVSHMKLCASRAFWLVAYPSQGHEMLFDAHTRSFAALGGVAAARHLRQHEDGGRQGQEGQGPRRQRALCGDVRALPVRPGLLQRRQRLGEGRRREERAGQPPSHLDRGGHGALAASPSSTPGWPSAAGPCGRSCATPSTQQFSVAEMLEHERTHLMPMPAPFDGYVEKPARVSSTCLVSVARNRYSVPCELFGGADGQHAAVPGRHRHRGG
jgi:hypothetical protein